MNYFKKKNKFAFKVRNKKLKSQFIYQHEGLKSAHKNKKHVELPTNSIDAYFDISTKIQ